MLVDKLIQKLEQYKGMDLEVNIPLKVCDEELQKRTYQYPYDVYKWNIDISDISYSDKRLILEVSIEESK